MNPLEAEGMSLVSYAVRVASACAMYFQPLAWGKAFLSTWERSVWRLRRRFVWEFFCRWRALLLGPAPGGFEQIRTLGRDELDGTGGAAAELPAGFEWVSALGGGGLDAMGEAGAELSGDAPNDLSSSRSRAAGSGEEGREDDGDGDGEFSGDVP